MASPPVSEEPGAWGASQRRFEVERLKRKDLSNWDDGVRLEEGEDQFEGQERLWILRAWGPVGYN